MRQMRHSPSFICSFSGVPASQPPGILGCSTCSAAAGGHTQSVSLLELPLCARLQRQPTAGGAAFDSRTSGLFCQLLDVRAPAEATHGNDSHFCDPSASRLAVHRVLRLERVSWAGVEDEQEQDGGLGV
jgi:hypothetical protein